MEMVTEASIELNPRSCYSEMLGWVEMVRDTSTELTPGFLLQWDAGIDGEGLFH